MSFPALPTDPLCLDVLYHFSHKLTAAEIGSWLLQTFLQTGQVLGLRLVRRMAAQVTYRVYEEESSAPVINAFRKRAEGKPVYGVKNPRAFTRWSSAYRSSAAVPWLPSTILRLTCEPGLNNA